MDNSRFKTKTGRCTAYALACGYLDQYELNGYQVTGWHEGACYHVRLHDFGTDARVGAGRILWDCFENMQDMRKRYDVAKRFIKKA